MPQPTLQEVMINEFYWFQRGRTLLDQAITARDDAAGKLVTAVGWFWTVYSAVAVVGVALADRSFSDIITIVLAIPAVLLLVAYGFGVAVMMPFNGTFDRDSPTEIEGAYKTVLARKKKRLGLAFGVSGVAGASVVAAVLVASFASDQKAAGLDLAFAENGGQGLVVLSGDVPPRVSVLFTVRTDEVDAGVVAEQVATSGADGSVDASLSVPIARSYRVEAEWTEDDSTHTIGQTLTP